MRRLSASRPWRRAFWRSSVRTRRRRRNAARCYPSRRRRWLRGGNEPGAALGPLYVKLSPREIEILDLVARGNSNKLIGRKLHISDQTVKNHVSAILRKLEVNDRTEAVVYALRNGWIQIEQIST